MSAEKLCELLCDSSNFTMHGKLVLRLGSYLDPSSSGTV